MSVPLPPSAGRRGLLLAAAALVALATLAYAFATRPPVESAEAPLAADGQRAADAQVVADGCLAVDVRAVDRVAAALRLGCEAPSPPPSLGNETAEGPAPSPAPATPHATPWPAPTWTVPTHAPSPLPRPTAPADAGGDETAAPGEDTTGEPTASEEEGPVGWSWWGPGPAAPEAPLPDALYDALAPLLSPPDATRPPPPETEAEVAPPEPCATVCDPRERGAGRDAAADGTRTAHAATRVGLLARALEAFDAYVRMRT